MTKTKLLSMQIVIMDMVEQCFKDDPDDPFNQVVALHLVNAWDTIAMELNEREMAGM